MRGRLRRLGRRLAGRRSAPAVSAAAAPGPPSWQRYAAYVRIHPEAEIAPSATLKILSPPDPPRICLEIGARSHVFASFTILRPEATVRVGERCQLGASNFVCAEGIEVGDDVLMAWGVTVMDNDVHALDWRARQRDAAAVLESHRADPENPLRNKDWSAVRRGRIAIGSKAWIGFNVSILKGVTIGEKAVVGAMSVVTHSVPDGAVIAGNPARAVRDRSDGSA